MGEGPAALGAQGARLGGGDPATGHRRRADRWLGLFLTLKMGWEVGLVVSEKQQEGPGVSEVGGASFRRRIEPSWSKTG